MLDKLRCFFGFHDWSMYRGYNGAPHHSAHCQREGCEAKPYALNER